MNWAELASRPVPWTSSDQAAGSAGGARFPFVLLTRVHCHRNFAGEPFPISASAKDCLRLAAKASSYAAGLGLKESVRLSECPPPVLRMLRERHLIAEPPVPLPGRKGVKHLASGAGEERFAWINEVEHVTWIQGFPGLLAPETFPSACPPPAEDPSSPWARSPRLGYLASDPSKAGPGISFRLLAHLPALVLARKLGQVHGALAALGLQLQTVTRMGPPGQAQESEPALFWLGSRGGLGLSPEDAYRRFIADVQPLLAWEADAQKMLLEKHRKRLEDRVHGSLRRLSGAVSLTQRDLRLLSSWARLGAYVGILDAQIPTLLEELRPRAQSGHLEVSSGRSLDKEEEDMARGSVVRLAMERFRARA